MDVIGFLCEPLGSSTGQLHDSVRSRRACERSEAGFVIKMSNVLEECNTEEKRFLMLFLSDQKDSMQRIFINKYFLLMVVFVA
jgi:hypothetical protein